MDLIFETGRLIVRRFTPEDGDLFFKVNGDGEVMRYIRPAKSREECDLFFHAALEASRAQPQYGRWAVEEKGSGLFVGSFALIPVEGTAHMQIGYALLPPAWGKGYATELAREGLRYAFEKTALTEVFAYTEQPNTASQKVLLKCGMRPVGEKEEGGKTLCIFHLTKREHSALFAATNAAVRKS